MVCPRSDQALKSRAAYSTASGASRACGCRREGIPLHAVIHRMLLNLWYMEKCWSNKLGLTNKEVESYRRAVGQFAIDWRALQWQSKVWVHWTCVHSGWFADEYRNFYIFSSIPTERRNVEFKMDIRHSFLGYKISCPYFSARAFTHALALMLLMWACRCGMRCMTQRTRSDTSDGERPKETNEMQHTALRQGCGTGAETGGYRRTAGRDKGQDRVVSEGCRKTAEPRQGGCREDKGCFGAVVGFYEMRTARAHMAAPVYTGSHWHREDVLVPKSHRMLSALSCLAAPHSCQLTLLVHRWVLWGINSCTLHYAPQQNYPLQICAFWSCSCETKWNKFCTNLAKQSN